MSSGTRRFELSRPKSDETGMRGGTETPWNFLSLIEETVETWTSTGPVFKNRLYVYVGRVPLTT